MKSVNQRRSKIQRTAHERKRFGNGVIKTTVSPYNDRPVDLDKEPKPKTKRPKELAAAADGKGGEVKIWKDDRSNEYSKADQDGADNRIIVRRDRDGVVLEIAYGEELVEVEIDPTSAENLIEHLRAALGG